MRLPLTRPVLTSLSECRPRHVANLSSTTTPTQTTAGASLSPSRTSGKFRPLDLGRGMFQLGLRPDTNRPRKTSGLFQPRSERQSPDQHWPSVWPAPRSFLWGAVPLPLRQGFVKERRQPPPDASANAELMKIANFLHLTPPAIEMHCKALRRFCTPWPDNLRDDTVLNRCLPMQVTTSDYVQASPEIGHEDARIVTIQLPLRALSLGESRHSRIRDKFLRLSWQWLVQEKGEEDLLRVVADRCPRRRQNYRHAIYQLAVCRLESSRCDGWEMAMRSRADHECFLWHGSASQRVCRDLWRSQSQENPEEMLRKVEGFVECSERVLDEPVPSERAIGEYGRAVCKLYGLPDPPVSALAV